MIRAVEKGISLTRRVITAGLLGIVLVAGSARITSATPQTATSGVVTVDDGTIRSRIESSLAKSSTLAPRAIDVDVSQGFVTLTGAVRTTSDRALAGRLANVAGVKSVINRIEVDPKIDQSKIDAAGEKTKSALSKAVDATVHAAEKTKGTVQKGVGKTEEGVGVAADKTAGATAKAGDKLSDASVSTRVKAGFSDERLLHDSAIDVDTSERVVTLRGTVSSRDARDRAAEIARGTAGVERVINDIVVGGQ